MAHFSEVHAKGFELLQENQKVSFDVNQGPKGKQAANIQPIGHLSALAALKEWFAEADHYFFAMRRDTVSRVCWFRT